MTTSRFALFRRTRRCHSNTHVIPVAARAYGTVSLSFVMEIYLVVCPLSMRVHAGRGKCLQTIHEKPRKQQMKKK